MMMAIMMIHGYYDHDAYAGDDDEMVMMTMMRW